MTLLDRGVSTKLDRGLERPQTLRNCKNVANRWVGAASALRVRIKTKILFNKGRRRSTPPLRLPTIADFNASRARVRDEPETV